MNRIPKIVILGAGYGGIATAIRLQKELNYNEAEVTLVNKHDYHYITTHLHKPAAGTDSAEKARIPISSLVDGLRVNFVKSTVTQIRPQEKQVVLEDGTLSFDYLVIGLGGDPETFGVPGLLEHALNIRSINSVRYIREHIEYQFATYKKNQTREDCLRFIVGGAGFTGIEFVGELADRIPKLCKKYDVDPALVKIYNIEAAPSALPGFDPELVKYAVQVLTNKGVTFMIGTAIKECLPSGVILATGEEIKAATVIWTGGIRGNHLVEAAGFAAMRGRVKVDSYLRTAEHENIYIVGDCSLVFNDQERPFPPTAQMATQQGFNCAHNLAATIRNQAMKEYKYEPKGTVASLGKGEAIGIIGKRKIKGGWAAFMKKMIDLRYLMIIGGIPMVIRKGRF